jgi:hypothetical protein
MYIGSTVIGHAINLYGYGANVYAGTGEGVLRTGNDFATAAVAESTSNGGYFSAFTGTARNCRRDDGSPGALSVSGTLVAYGVYSNYDRPSGNTYACPMPGYRMRWTKVNSKADWIRQLVEWPPTPFPCRDNGVIRDCRP